MPKSSSTGMPTEGMELYYNQTGNGHGLTRMDGQLKNRFETTQTEFAVDELYWYVKTDQNKCSGNNYM